MWRDEGFQSLFKGFTPRVLGVAPGQAIVYERVTGIIETDVFRVKTK